MNERLWGSKDARVDKGFSRIVCCKVLKWRERWDLSGSYERGR